MRDSSSASASTTSSAICSRVTSRSCARPSYSDPCSPSIILPQQWATPSSTLLLIVCCCSAGLMNKALDNVNS